MLVLAPLIAIALLGLQAQPGASAYAERARALRLRFEYRAALQLLELALKGEPDSAPLLAECGALYLAAEEPARALPYFDRALAIDPSCEEAVSGRAAADLAKRDYEAAEQRLRLFLSKRPKSVRARLVLARVLFETDRIGEAASLVRTALDAAPEDAEALYLLAQICSVERKPAQARQLARRALQSDPFHMGARRLLSQYVNGRAGYDQKVSERARIRYERARALKSEGNLSEALRELRAALELEPRYYRAMIAMAGALLGAGDPAAAAQAAERALEVDPDGSLAHLLLSLAHAELRERARMEIGCEDFAAEFDRRAAPDLDERLIAEVFPDYRRLNDRQRKLIRISIAPLFGFLPKLARIGAQHRLLELDQRVIEVRGFEGDEEELTFDGRYYASLRGASGKITLSGIEQVDAAARCEFNAIAHEFAHLVHIFALGQSDREAIKDLYEAAVKGGRALDYYAATNEFEYFAQGYEAFVSECKRPLAGGAARHTRAELKRRDPALYDFLKRLQGRS
jgi:Tfp pilus assembly protein PilF